MSSTPCPSPNASMALTSAIGPTFIAATQTKPAVSIPMTCRARIGCHPAPGFSTISTLWRRRTTRPGGAPANPRSAKARTTSGRSSRSVPPFVTARRASRAAMVRLTKRACAAVATTAASSASPRIHRTIFIATSHQSPNHTAPDAPVLAQDQADEQPPAGPHPAAISGNSPMNRLVQGQFQRFTPLS